ncbi:homocysteine S-methyltransferase [Crenobacter caeni]|uniref:S-methylmethionine:homocysteine methyltransferase n=1 Tax=Crenobacter caeni TaxID=2705474 RepID=A0A6B2KV99_9NEIS|nr:homocysteine S-methyltransferase [Crenobacter caeni]NDV13929.1 homocysteine S-methyltransferase [Crenobacter caeni]
MTANPLEALLAREPFVLLDGALATELEARGADLSGGLWSARVLTDAPELIRAVHADYLCAGADIITSASYQASFAGFARAGLAHDAAARLMARAIELAREARDAFWAVPENRAGRGYPLVAASVGPYGATLADGSEYRGGYGLSVEQLMDFHRERLASLIAAGPDLLACETLPCAEEAVALARLFSAEFPDARAWLAFSCRDGASLADGTPLADALAAIDACPQVLAVGVNCTAPGFVAQLLRAARGVTGKPLIAYPNSGECWDAALQSWHGHGDDVAGDAPGWLAAGARLIGGCCRTTPATIAALAALRARLKDAASRG